MSFRWTILFSEDDGFINQKYNERREQMRMHLNFTFSKRSISRVYVQLLRDIVSICLFRLINCRYHNLLKWDEVNDPIIEFCITGQAVLDIRHDPYICVIHQSDIQAPPAKSLRVTFRIWCMYRTNCIVCVNDAHTCRSRRLIAIAKIGVYFLNEY